MLVESGAKHEHEVVDWNFHLDRHDHSLISKQLLEGAIETVVVNRPLAITLGPRIPRFDWLTAIFIPVCNCFGCMLFAELEWIYSNVMHQITL